MRALLRCAVVLAFCGVVPLGQAKRAPNLELKDVSGKTQKVSDLRGSIALVNFWATWCGPCQEELPMLSRLAAEYSDKKVRFIAVSADEARDRARLDRFLETHKLGMDVWVGGNVYMLDRADLGKELPATMILDADGQVVARMLGEAREAEVRSVLDWLVGGKMGPAPPDQFKHY